MIPRARGGKQALVLCALLAGCAGGGDGPDTQVVRGEGFTFAAPGGWDVEEKARARVASRPGGVETIGVTVFRLARPFRPALWPKAVRELDEVAERLARELAPGARVATGRTQTLASRRARVYEIAYERDDGARLVERVAFLLVGRREYQLVCRIDVAEPDPGELACAQLFRSFRPA